MPDSILDSVQIPDEFVELSSRWYDGSGSMMYALVSVGNLSRGSIRPTVNEGYWEEYPRIWTDVYREMTDLEWYRSLFEGLSSDIMWALHMCDGISDPELAADLDDLKRFEKFVDECIERIDAEIEREESGAHH